MNESRVTRALFRMLLGAMVGGLMLPVQAADATYVNNGIIQVPPQVAPSIDATNFINNNIINLTLGLGVPYETSSTLNYTNRGSMTADLGFRFRNNSPFNSSWTPSANFENTGLISAGSGGFAPFELPRIIINATNIISRGTNVVGLEGLFQATGEHLDFSRSAIVMESPGQVGFGTGVGGLNVGYWGLGTNVISPPSFEVFPPSTPFHIVEQPCSFPTFTRLVLTNGIGYTRDFIVGSNRTVQVAFVDSSNPAFSNNVYFLGETIVVEWVWQSANSFSGGSSTNYMYLFDDLLGRTGTNISTVTNFGGSCVSGQPINYSFQLGGPFFLGSPWPVSPPSGNLPFGIVSNNYTAFSADFTASTEAPGSAPGSPGISNLSGRIEFNASKSLDLNLARISGLNYLKLSSTNHFKGSDGAKILSVYTDVDLASTNGSLTITNLLLPSVNRPVGDVNLYSAKWEVTDQSVSNRYHVLFVQSLLETSVPSGVQDLRLRASNSVTISDSINILRNLLIDTENLTLTTNAPGADTATGALNMVTNSEVGPANFPSLRNLTNAGLISISNFFRLGTPANPLNSVINTGRIFSEGTTMNVDLLMNQGIIGASVGTLGSGSLDLTANTAIFTNGSILAPNGDVVLAANDLVVSNNVLLALRRLSLSITNSLDDGGIMGSNLWAAGNDGFRLLQRPVTGDLLGTTIANVGGTFVVVPNLWDGRDVGRVPEGFVNNGALGKLILRGTNGTVFNFSAVHGTNALYADLVELQGSTTNIDSNGNLTGMGFGPNMKLYYGDMLANGESVAERLNGKNNGGLQWVPGYAGYHSGTNMIYPDGTTNRLNRALVTSCNLDSDGDLTPNCADPSPVFVGSQLNFRAALTNVPPAAMRLTWNAIQESTSTVFYKGSLNDSNWTVLTNVTVTTVPPYGARPVGVTDSLAVSNRYYRLEFAVPQP